MEYLTVGSGRLSNANATPKGIMIGPIEESERYVLDSNAPLHVPREKVTYTQKWNWTSKGQEGSINLGSMSIFDKIKNLRWNLGTIVDTELHVIFLPHLPVEIYRTKSVNITLRFNGIDDQSEGTLAIASFPICLHTHVIFLPGHSFSLKRGGHYPWSLELTTDADIKPDYTTADIILQLMAYNTPLSQYSEKRGAHIISLVPPSEKPTGVILTRPRMGGEWITNKVKMGIKRQKDLDIIKIIQDAGVDIEALQSLGVLKEIMSVVCRSLLKIKEVPENEQSNIIRSITLAVVKKRKV